MQVEIAVKCDKCDGFGATLRSRKHQEESGGKWSVCTDCHGNGHIFKKAEICFIGDDDEE